jgi:hypothetical protein
MIKKLVFIFSFTLLVSLAARAQSTNLLHFPASAFSIAPLESPGTLASQVPLMMCLPATDGFSPNVNVNIQHYPGTIDEYLTLSLGQLKTAGFNVIEHKMAGTSAVVFEYAGETQGRKLHWYARAEKKAGKMYLATATATDDQWSRVGDLLKACVDSFHCDNGQ